MSCLRKGSALPEIPGLGSGVQIKISSPVYTEYYAASLAFGPNTWAPPLGFAARLPVSSRCPASAPCSNGRHQNCLLCRCHQSVGSSRQGLWLPSECCVRECAEVRAEKTGRGVEDRMWERGVGASACVILCLGGTWGTGSQTVWAPILATLLSGHCTVWAQTFLSEAFPL